MKKLLIVEDETALLRALNNKFTKEGFDVIDAKNGEEGLEKALKNEPDLILLDIIMPIMDGLSMLKELRKTTWGKQAKVLILTNLSEAHKVEEAMNSGVYDFLIKSDWSLEQLVEKVKAKLA